MARWIVRKYWVFIIVVAMLIGMVPKTALADPIPPQIDLGTATLTAGIYNYPDAVVSGEGIRTILISFSQNVTSGDRIVLPASPTGFTVSASSNDYAKRINLDSGVATNDIRDYLRNLGAEIESANQTLSITVTTESINADTFYNSGTQHFYQYIPSTTDSWTSAYNEAKNMNFMGRDGYLATVMSMEEDTYLNSLSGGNTGWLGGTILSNTGSTGTSLYYDGFDVTSIVSTGWYWACGPEKGTTFFNTTTLSPGANSTKASEADALNTGNYYNWARGTTSYEPNNQTYSLPYTEGDYETCLTTLEIEGNTGKHGTTFSWNDKHYTSAGSGEWDSKGYFVEYGNRTRGDEGNASTAFTSDREILYKPDSTPRLVTVNGSYADLSGAGSYTAGAQVRINAGTRSGYTFTGWSIDSGSPVLQSTSSAETTFTMPPNAVTLTANWTGDQESPNVPDITGLASAYTLFIGGTVTLKPDQAGGSWSLDRAYLSMTKNGNRYIFTAHKKGNTTLTYKVAGASWPISITIREKTVPGTGDESTTAGNMKGFIILGLAVLMIAWVLTGRRKA